MTDIICCVCGVPKPPICYEGNTRKKDMCSSCRAAARKNRDERYARGEKGRAGKQRSNRKLPNDELAARIAIAAAWRYR